MALLDDDAVLDLGRPGVDGEVGGVFLDDILAHHIGSERVGGCGNGVGCASVVNDAEGIIGIRKLGRVTEEVDGAKPVVGNRLVCLNDDVVALTRPEDD